MRGLRPSSLVVLLLTLVGCSSSASSVIEDWASRNGGRIFDERLQRAQTLAANLHLPNGEEIPFQVSVLNDPRPVAYSWPDGQVFVSRGLADVLDDAMLSAAMAHEIAHVIIHRERTSIAALQGADASLQVETRADQVGVELLFRSGIPRSSMSEMLSVIARVGVTPQVRANLLKRIELLQQLDAARPHPRSS